MKIQFNNSFELRLRVLANGAIEPLSSATAVRIFFQNLDAPTVRWAAKCITIIDDEVVVAVDACDASATGHYLVSLYYDIAGAQRYAENAEAFVLVRSADEADAEGASISADLRVAFAASGKNGLSAYELAVQGGYVGSFEDWLHAGLNANNAAQRAYDAGVFANSAAQRAERASQQVETMTNTLGAQLLYNNDTAQSNVFIDGTNLCIKPNGFGVVVAGKTYYVATTTSQTANYTFAGSNPYLVIDVSQLTNVGARNEVATVVKSRTQAQLKDTDIVIAYYYAAGKKWMLTNLFADLYDAPAKAKAIETNTSNIAKNTSNITTNADAIARVEDVSYNLSVLGAGMTFVKRELFLLPGHTYRFYVANPKWGKNEITSKSATIFQIKQIVSGTEKLLAVVYKENEGGTRDVKSYYDFTAVEGATYEIGIRANKGEVVQFVSHDITDTLDHGSILYLNDERDIVPKMLAATRAAKRTGSTESLTPQLVLAHFSDIHASKPNYNRVMEFCDKYSEYINDILHTGDTVNDTFGSISAWWSNNKVLNCIGNHDTAKYENGKYNWTGATPQETYNNYFAPYIASWGVVQPENAAEQGRCYYYKDYTEQGVRLITLDCMRYDDAQHAWLSQVLDNAKSAGLHVLVAVHYPLDRGTAVDTPFHSLQDTYTSEADSRIADVVASSGVQFIAYLAGHTHWDAFFKVNGHEEQVCVCVDTATLGDAYNDSARVAGTKNQDCFNIFSVDTYGKMFRIFRVGCDRDRWMRHKGTICWDYANGKLIYQD